jgi:hypothetical protein
VTRWPGPAAGGGGPRPPAPPAPPPPPAAGGSYSSAAEPEGDAPSTGGTLASDEALAALRAKLAGGE